MSQNYSNYKIETDTYYQLEPKSPVIILKESFLKQIQEYVETIKNRKDVFFYLEKQNPLHHFIINSKKVKLKYVYSNLKSYLENLLDYELIPKNIQDLSPGTYTNYLSKNFEEPNTVTMILTKKYNNKEKSILKELKSSNIPVNLLLFGKHTNNITWPSKFKVFQINSVKSLYLFLYALDTLVNRKYGLKQETYGEFKERYQPK